MTGTTESAGEQATAALRDQLASFRPLLALSMVMTGSRDESEILSIATTAVPSVGGCRTEGVHLDDDWRSVGPVGRPANTECLQTQLAALDRFGGALTVDAAAWVWAYPLTGLDEMAGHLVVSSDSEPEPHHQFLLTVLAQQAGTALLNARLHARERAGAARERAIADQLRAANLALEQAMAELERSAAAVQRSLDIHNRLTAVASAGQGQEGIARTLHELTGLPVAIEDRHGNLTAWAGPGRPDPYPKPSPARREQSLRRALDARGPVRDKSRLIALAQPGSEVLGVIALVDPDRTAGDSAKVALEHANTVLTLELAHLQALGETELRLRRDLVEELLAGTDPESGGPSPDWRPEPSRNRRRPSTRPGRPVDDQRVTGRMSASRVQCQPVGKMSAPPHRSAARPSRATRAAGIRPLRPRTLTVPAANLVFVGAIGEAGSTPDCEIGHITAAVGLGSLPLHRRTHEEEKPGWHGNYTA